MNSCIKITILAVCVSMVKAGQLISAYNLISPQVVYPQAQTYSIGVVHPQYFSSLKPQEQVLAHPTALATSLEESTVPHSLKKSDNFYNNPYIARSLASESLTFNKEQVVYDRASEHIERGQIVKLINNLNRAHYE
ncbi:uncharacterized protein LOC126738935 [Anthonomus grandis grandis]|uniref:uncharacterized protein LOC126738935 n=1 Tax=Anthonomus grandis grandis TaxID=2921223 RepID=UPI002166393D|nr:uncharacterized protein LOC126738935 [Anthonomus grandis grandis]